MQPMIQADLPVQLPLLLADVFEIVQYAVERSRDQDSQWIETDSRPVVPAPDGSSR